MRYQARNEFPGEMDFRRQSPPVDRQWIRLSWVLLLALIARVALGAPSQPPTTNAHPLPSLGAGAVTREEVRLGTTSGIEVQVSPGLFVVSESTGIEGRTAFSASVGTLFPLLGGFLVGADLGIDTGGAGPNTSVTGLRFLGTVLYRGTLGGSPKVRPFVGLSVGPHLVMAKQTIPGFAEVTEQQKVYLNLMFRSGIGFLVSRDFEIGLEPRAGLSGSSFVFQPQIFIAATL